MPRGPSIILHVLPFLFAGAITAIAGAHQRQGPPDDGRAILRAAREEPDLAAALAGYERFLLQHPERVSWCSSAAYDAFRRMLTAPGGRFSGAELQVAALRAARWSRRAVDVNGNPSAHVVRLLQLAVGLRERSPAAALAFADRGEEFVLSTHAGTEEYTAEAATKFAAPRLLVLADFESWNEAYEAADAAVDGVDGLHEVMSSPRVRIDEDAVRRAAALSYEHAGEVARAWRLFWFLAESDESNGRQYTQFLERHALENSDRAPTEARFARELESARVAARASRKAEVLSTLEDTVIEELSPVDAEGRPFDLPAGRCVVLVWATWCVPCHWQLEDFSALDLPDDVTTVAISVDESRAEAVEHWRGLDLPFTFAHLPNAHDELSAATGIPKLFVLSNGRIRFRRTGHDRGSGPIVGEDLGWMLEAIE